MSISAAKQLNSVNTPIYLYLYMEWWFLNSFLDFTTSDKCPSPNEMPKMRARLDPEFKLLIVFRHCSRLWLMCVFLMKSAPSSYLIFTHRDASAATQLAAPLYSEHIEYSIAIDSSRLIQPREPKCEWWVEIYLVSVACVLWPPHIHNIIDVRRSTISRMENACDAAGFPWWVFKNSLRRYCVS